MFAVISSIGTVAVMEAAAAAAATTTASAVVAKPDQAISVPKHVDCERQCPYYYFPICATNGNPAENRMFVNICEMHAWNCDVEKSKRKFKMNAIQILNSVTIRPKPKQKI